MRTAVIESHGHFAAIADTEGGHWKCSTNKDLEDLCNYLLEFPSENAPSYHPDLFEGTVKAVAEAIKANVVRIDPRPPAPEPEGEIVY